MIASPLFFPPVPPQPIPFPPVVDLEDLLDPFQQFGVNLGLQRIRHLLDRLGNPQNRVPIIHVAGSNGKGSVCTYLYHVLWQGGYRVGCYTSPHLVSWCERIQFCGDYITPADLRDVLTETIAAIDPTAPTPTLFEIVTAAAWLYFAEQQADLVVMEVGLGGRLDATNVTHETLATVITSISREHWQVLGDTLGAIAAQKAGILKPHCPAIVGPLPAEARVVVEDRISALHCPALWIRPAIPSPPETLPEELRQQAAGFPLQTLRYGGRCYGIRLQGAVQRINSALAIATLETLQRKGWTIAEEALLWGLATAQWPGRLQWTTWNDRPLLLDGAHNPAAATVLRSDLDKMMADLPQKSITWVMGMISTKDHRDIFQALLRPGDRLHLVPVPGHSSADPHALATLAQDVMPSLARCEAYPDLFVALNAAFSSPESTTETSANLISQSIAQPSPTVLCGSLYLLGYFFHRQQPLNP